MLNKYFIFPLILAFVSCGKSSINLTGSPSNNSPSSTINLAPVAVDDVRYLNENGALLPIAALSNDSDPNGDTLSIVSVSASALGTAVVNGTNIDYTPNASTYGSETLTVTIQDPSGETDTSNLTIHIMTQWTWTGDGGDSNWNTNANWCGSVNGTNTGCNGAGSSPTTSGNLAVFSGGCSQCNATINGTYTLGKIEMLSSYTGTITQQNGSTLTLDTDTNSLTVNGGNFIGGDATSHLDIDEFYQAGGNFIAPAGNMNIGYLYCTASHTDGFTISGGSFSHNNGTVIFDAQLCTGASSTRSVLSIDVPASGTIFYNLIIDIADASASYGYDGAYISIANGDTLTVTNDLTLKDGFICDGSFELQGNLIVECADGSDDSGICSGASFDYCSGVTDPANIIFNGNTPQTYSVASNAKAPGIIVNTTSTVSPAVGTTEFSVAEFELLSGTFNAPSANFSIGHSFKASSNSDGFIVSGGTFSHNNGTVVLNADLSDAASADRTTLTVDVPGAGLDLYNLKINANDKSPSQGFDGAYINMASGDSLTVLNDLTLSDGYMCDGTINLKGNLIVECADGSDAAGSCSGGYFRNCGSSTEPTAIIFNGNSPQTYSVTSGGYAYDVIIDTSSTVSPLGGTTEFNMGEFELRSGTFTAPTGNMSVGFDSPPNSDGFTVTGGTFVHNNGTLVLNPSQDWATSSTNNVMTIDLPVSGLTINNLTFDISDLESSNGFDGAYVTIATGDILTVAGNLILRNGFIQGGNINVQGDFSVECADGSDDAGSCSGVGTTNITMQGSALQAIDQAAGGQIPGSVFTFDNANNFQLDTLIDLNGQDIDVVSGDIDMNGFNFTGINDISTYSGTITKNGGLLDYVTCSAGGCPADDL